jgi:hypothetical protein
LARVLDAVEQIDKGNRKASLKYHGLSQSEMVAGLKELLSALVNKYTWQESDEFFNAKAKAAETSAPQVDDLPSPPVLTPVRSRLASTVHNPSAAKKMEEYVEAKGLNQTEFAIQAGTTDKTIRKFRTTGKIRRSILPGIAKAMGISKDELLKQ